MADGAVDTGAFRPLYPKPHKNRLSLPGFLWRAWRDPLTVYGEEIFHAPQIYVEGPVGASLTLASPAGVKHVLLDNFKNYEKGEFQRKIFGPLIGEGLLLNEGDDWRRTRRLLAPLFTPARIATLLRRMQAICVKRVAAWPRRGVIDIDHEMTGITFEIISDALFSNMLGGQATEFERALNAFVETAGRISPLDFLGAPAWIPRLSKIGGVQPGKFFETRVAQLVAARRALLARGELAPDDLLSALLNARDEEGGPSLSEAEVAANVLTFILAGYETTSRALGWTLHLLARTPHYQEHVHAETAAFDLTREDWQDALPWTRAVLDEAMRLFPPAPATMRFAIEPDVVCGQKIPAGTMVIVPPWVLHRHTKLWDEPDAFKPERFLPGAREEIDRFAYIPFSGGPRICIGAAFSIQEAMIALAVALRDYSFTPASEAEPMPKHLLTLRAEGGIKLIVRKR